MIHSSYNPIMSTYDKHYRNPEYFGDPYPGLVSFFSDYEPKGNVLDLGCGQGRDSIALARMGYNVTSIDISKVGISHLQATAKNQNLDITAKAADMYCYKIDERVDIVLLDSILHFYKPDEMKETKFLLRIMNELKIGGLLCILVWKSQKLEKKLENVLRNVSSKWRTIVDRYIAYPEKNMDMRMMCQRKLSK